jgi:hypothetical protein
MIHRYACRLHMTHDREVWGAVVLLVQRYGAAVRVAEERAREALQREDDVVARGV